MDSKIRKDLECVIAKSSTFITRTNTFKKMASRAFNDMDKNDSKAINEEELYAGILLLHLKIAKYAGPSACYPPSKNIVKEYFVAMDDDKSGRIEENEFVNIAVILCSTLATRIIFQWAMTIFLIPFLTRRIIAVFVKINGGDIKFRYLDISAMSQGWMKNLILGMPYTILSSILLIVCIPMAIGHIDSFFLEVAGSVEESVEAEKKNNDDTEEKDGKLD